MMHKCLRCPKKIDISHKLCDECFLEKNLEDIMW